MPNDGPTRIVRVPLDHLSDEEVDLVYLLKHKGEGLIAPSALSRLRLYGRQYSSTEPLPPEPDSSPAADDPDELDRQIEESRRFGRGHADPL